jgi:hypothetical protein
LVEKVINIFVLCFNWYMQEKVMHLLLVEILPTEQAKIMGSQNQVTQCMYPAT